MLDRQQMEMVRFRIAQLKLIIGALILAVGVFSGIVIVVNQGLSFPQPVSTLSLVAAGLAGFILFTAFWVPVVVRRNGVAQIDPLDTSTSELSVSTLQRLLNIWFSAAIVGCALVESAAFLNLIVGFMEHQGINVLAALVLLLVMVAFFPSANRVAAWIDDQAMNLRRGRH